jgi:hypothetical protein
VAQSLRNGFLTRTRELRAYLAGLFHRAVKVPEEIPREKHSLAELVLGLLEGFPEAACAFIHHGYYFHRKFRLGLA